jgi:hypothetical protein
MGWTTSLLSDRETSPDRGALLAQLMGQTAIDQCSSSSSRHLATFGGTLGECAC